MGKALLLALLCAPAVGVALTDLGDSTPRSVTTHPGVDGHLAGATPEMRKMQEEMQEKLDKMEVMRKEMTSMLGKDVGQMGEMWMKVDRNNPRLDNVVVVI